MHVLTWAGEYIDLCSESFGFEIFIYRGGGVFLRIVDVLATSLGLLVIWADDILRIECHLAVNAKTNQAVLIDKSFNKLE